ncbi:hypothetical protein B296_00006738 [Ensete ventricosum]|uniref:Uncharacterized protein n=1 Tax=Ensete ventricosum TaxID=4639 RepID=A0A427ASI5_ENSVE|nr:hypothetical protein B296_00006738 [Ensete ventricosum]
MGCGVNRLQRKITAGSFLPQGSLLAVIKEDGSERSLLAVLCRTAVDLFDLRLGWKVEARIAAIMRIA